mgnify:CR=1 FL=1
MTAPETEGAPGRTRPRPSERMAGAEQLVDVRAALAALRAESHVLLDFEPGAGLPRHTAPAPAAIHGVEGAVVLHTPSATHRVAAGQVLVLDADVPHDVVAEEGAAAILVVLAMPPAVNAGAAPPAG